MTFRAPNLGQGDIIEFVNKQTNHVVFPFNLSELLAKDQNFGPKLVSGTKEFLPETEQPLGQHISNFCTCFQFGQKIVLQPNSPKSVIVVEVIVLRKVSFDNADHPNIAFSQILLPGVCGGREELLLGMNQRGFVEYSPNVVLLEKRKEFDRGAETCAICLDGFVDVDDDDKISTTVCSHVFHNHCPTCRLVLPFIV
ncbi:hypothetical protein ACH5RR_006560 [Cinchona calisaya]|uniref:RING-type domain-containing protein n=1 Tax=Cinchona calisaya TaxID=153742 RepID=A0ABD3APB2_9GENT